jgi:hypothetical protein
MDVWWGYSKTRGWVILDRSIPQNKPSRGCDFQFIDCSNWSIFTEKRSLWKQPNYIFVDRYLESLETECSEKVVRELTELKKQFASQRESLFTRYITQLHIKFLTSKGRTILGVRKAQGKRRITHCYACQEHLDNAVDLECASCNWIICGNCGACGCGYEWRGKDYSNQT